MIDGKTIAHDIAEELSSHIRERGKAPTLDIIVVGENAVTESFVRTKQKVAQNIGVTFNEHRFVEHTGAEEIIDEIASIVARGTDGIVVQLPLPAHMDTPRILAHIPHEYDVDFLTDEAFRAYAEGSVQGEPPVAGAVREILERNGVSVKGKKAVVVGKGKLVGEPVALMLRLQGVSDIVMVDRSTPLHVRDAALMAADIVVSGAGVPNLITTDMVKEGVVLIDAGTSNAGRTIIGDISLDCEQKASVFSKTPGGVGPVTVAVLYRNVMLHAERSGH